VPVCGRLKVVTKARKQYSGEEPKGVPVARLAHKRYEKTRQLRDERRAKKNHAAIAKYPTSQHHLGTLAAHIPT